MNKAHTIIIAEAGVNHNGDIATAMKLIQAGAAAGVDYVKFQTFKAERLVTTSAVRAQYQADNCGGAETQFQMLKRLELSDSELASLRDECLRCGIGFLSSPFDIEAIETLASLGMTLWKIPSGEITNLPFLRAIAAQKGDIILSTGMSILDEVSAAVDELCAAGAARDRITLLHCTTQYPTPMRDVNLRAMDQLASLGCKAVGYSDHTPGITIPIAAVARGAAVIEKHFTLDRNMTGPDHKASLEPDELSEMVRTIRQVEEALGSPDKHVTPSELPNIAVARKSIVAACPIKKGELLTAQNITIKRPGMGLSPMLWDSVIGAVATQDFDTDQLISI